MLGTSDGIQRHKGTMQIKFRLVFVSVGLAHWGVLYFSYYKEQEEKKDIRK
jgi:hypothetical protein